jgi:DNA-binding NtrC family response regulator
LIASIPFVKNGRAVTAKRKRILVVDDRTENRDAIAALLTIGGAYAAAQAQAIGDALNRIRVQNDGNVVIYSQSGEPLWQTGTRCQ